METVVEESKAKAIVEALLFVSSAPVSLGTLKKLLQLSENRLEEVISELINDYTEANRGIQIVTIAEGYQMVTNPDYSEWVKKLTTKPSSNRLSQRTLETLAIIAYKQPVTRVEVDTIRGVHSDGSVKTLLERKLIKIIGRKEVPGRPLLYGTTNEFLRYFGVRSLKDLPTIKDFQIR
ncbi:MAG TPA: SMC-Scp complex subunit ScpB [Thermodesulfovibrionia bacterium]|nr:SMC-Scp complex subunit ScpB [Thermodesulfovibrionia bacterium]